MTATFATDDELMGMVGLGDAAAFAELCGRYERQLTGWLNRRLGDWQKAEDMAQETFLRIYSKASSYLPNGQFSGWLFRIASNLIVDQSRRQKNDWIDQAISSRPSKDHDDLVTRFAAEGFDVGDSIDQHELAEMVDEILTRIPDDQRMTFTLAVFVGLSLPEIAEAMETNLPTTKSRMRLAREKIRERLQAYGICDPRLMACV